MLPALHQVGALQCINMGGLQLLPSSMALLSLMTRLRAWVCQSLTILKCPPFSSREAQLGRKLRVQQHRRVICHGRGTIWVR